MQSALQPPTAPSFLVPSSHCSSDIAIPTTWPTLESCVVITFAVADVAPAPRRLPSSSLQASLQARSLRAFEAAASNQARLVDATSLHGFVAAAHVAFDRHYPLVLSPDDVWLCLAQAFATHVGEHAEALRSRLVRHQSKVKLTVRRDDFVMGSPANDWPGMFAELSDRIAEHVGKRRDLVVADFSTTGPVEQAASQVVLFDAFKSYFDYSLMTMCGIPEVTLLGTVADWRSIRTRAAALAEFDLGDWVAVLLPVLDEIVKSAGGRADRAFWQSFYKLNGGSGGPYVNGWINVLFPYVKDHRDAPRPNRHALHWEEGMSAEHGGGPGTADFTRGLSFAPFEWEYLGEKIPMMFTGGFVGVAQDASTGAVRPAIGWAISAATDGPDAQAREEEEAKKRELERSLRVERESLVIGPAGVRLRITLGRETIVDTERALEVREVGRGPRYYVPRDDVRALLEEGRDRGRDQWKGEWRSLDVTASGKTIVGGAWIYVEPTPVCEALRDHVGFYPEEMSSFKLG